MSAWRIAAILVNHSHAFQDYWINDLNRKWPEYAAEHWNLRLIAEFVLVIVAA